MGPLEAAVRVADATLIFLGHLKVAMNAIPPSALPSMLMAMAFLISTPVRVAPVNWLPWSVLKMSGLP